MKVFELMTILSNVTAGSTIVGYIDGNEKPTSDVRSAEVDGEFVTLILEPSPDA